MSPKSAKTDIFAERPSFIDLKLEHDKLNKMFPPKPTGMKKENNSLISLTENILNRLNQNDSNTRLSSKHKECLPILTSRRKNRPRKALKQLDCNSILTLENINRLRLERMRKRIINERVFDPHKVPRVLRDYMLEFSEVLIRYLSVEDNRAFKDNVRFRKCADERELRCAQVNHFAIQNRDRRQKRCKSVDLRRKNLTEKNMDQLLYVLSQNKNNRLTQVNEKEGQGLFKSICKSGPHIMYDRFSKKLVKFLKLNLRKQLTGYQSVEDLVLRVRDAFRPRPSAQDLLVIGRSSANSRHNAREEAPQTTSRNPPNEAHHVSAGIACAGDSPGDHHRREVQRGNPLQLKTSAAL